jgi:hypothetical protein
MMRVMAVFAVLLLSADAVGAERLVFEGEVRALLKARCFQCHGEAEELSGGLDVRLRRLIVSGGDSGPAIEPGDAESSYLVQRLRDGDMPPEGHGDPLTAEEIALVVNWVNHGAPTAGPEPEEIGSGLVITEADRQHWSFQPVERPPLPTVRQVEMVHTPIDAFLLAKLEEAGLTFSPEADRRTLIRRASFDLLGLPPSPQDVADFIADDSPDAYERLIDRLLASPHYGERWGRHWLDVAGYADSEGVTNDDTPRPWAWKYRDYVIGAFNANLPYDRFVTEQLAGDELADGTAFVATGFLRTAPDGTASTETDAGVARNQVVADTIEIVSGALLGMTVECAQCHEHRYDPIPQADYFRLRAVFEPALNPQQWRTPPQRLVSLYTDADRRQAAALEVEAKEIDAERSRRQAELIETVYRQQLNKVPEAEREAVAAAHDTPAKQRTKEQQSLLRKHPSVNVTAGSLYLYDKQAADELEKLAAKAKAVRDRKPKQEFIRALTEVPGQVPQTFLFHRGDHEQPRQAVAPGDLTVLGGPEIPPDDPKLPTTGRRLAYADCLTSGEHPLVARVFVNRVWMHHFGRGIVETPGDFGHLGTRPTHPELLDWLAAEFVQSGWNVKRLHRLVMLSAAYRQRSRELRAKSREPDSDSGSQLSALSSPLSTDPENRLLWHMPLRRLDAEAVRDAVLAVSGKLNPKPFGTPVPVMADLVGQWVIGIENLNAGRPGPVLPMHGEEFRRSVYVQVRRSRPLAVLETFDAPRMEPHCEVRTNTTVAPQSLLMLNGTFTLAQSEHFADRLLHEAGDDVNEQVALAWQLTYGRDPSAVEQSDAVSFLAAQTRELTGRVKKGEDPRRAALASLCQVLLGSNEFLYVD